LRSHWPAHFATSVSFLLKHRGAVRAPPVRVRHPLRSATELFRSRWFALGWLLAIVAWGFHVGALALAPLSIVQAVLSAGLVFLAVISERFFGFHLGQRQWTGVIITAAGLAIIGLTQDAQPGGPPRYALAALITVECTVLVLAAGAATISGRLGVMQARQGLLLGVIAGGLFGVSDIAIKFLTEAVGDGILQLISPWTAAALGAGVFAFYASARALQLGPGVESSRSPRWRPRSSRSSAASWSSVIDRDGPRGDRRAQWSRSASSSAAPP
jgi:drug/metabolite transporter (DMT)-like permease